MRYNASNLISDGGDRMLNKTLFRAELVKNGYTFKSMADEIGISERTFSKRVKTGDFGSAEIDIMISLLHIDDPRPIFFAQLVT